MKFEIGQHQNKAQLLIIWNFYDANKQFNNDNKNDDLLQTHGPYRRHSKQRMSTKMVSHDSLQNSCLHMITRIGEKNLNHPTVG